MVSCSIIADEADSMKLVWDLTHIGPDALSLCSVFLLEEGVRVLSFPLILLVPVCAQ